jgi:hypothetical protein
MLGEDKDWLDAIAMQLGPEDGRPWIYDTDDHASTYGRPFITSRTDTERRRPPCSARQINGATRAHSASVRPLG